MRVVVVSDDAAETLIRKRLLQAIYNRLTMRR